MVVIWCSNLWDQMELKASMQLVSGFLRLESCFRGLALAGNCALWLARLVGFLGYWVWKHIQLKEQT